MRHDDSTEVLVVGAGPVGMFTALLLAKDGIRVRVVDQQERSATHSYACALHPRSLELLDGIGLAGEIVERGRRVERVAFYEADKRRAEVSLGDLPVRYPFVVVLAQSDFEGLLEARLRRMEHVAVDWNCRLGDFRQAAGGVVGTLHVLAETAKGYMVADWERAVQRTLEMDAKFLVAADGHHSLVRRRLGVAWETSGATERFEVYEVEGDARLGGEMRVALQDEWSSVVWPLENDRYRWSFQVSSVENEEELPEKDRLRVIIQEPSSGDDSHHRLERLLKSRAPWWTGDIGEIDWSARMQFAHRVAGRFGVDRCWLAGDAVHQTGPVGMQSMNMGLREAADLSGRLKRILRQGASACILDTYDQEHRGEWRTLLGMEGVEAADHADPWIARHRERIPGCIPATGPELEQLLGGLGLQLG